MAEKQTGRSWEDRLQPLKQMDRPATDEAGEYAVETGHMHVVDFLSYRLSMLSRVLDRSVEVSRKQDIKTGLTEKRLLSYLCANPPTTLRAIARGMCLDKAQISRAAAALVQMGMVSRESDSADRRSATFSATREGRDYYDMRLDIARGGQQEILAQLNAEEYRVLSGAIDKLLAYAIDRTSKDRKC
jgi:DNA-binding MarR family transcriptional regulator